jgi:glutathione synthase/RimK-type ligase-like ATP-grasp enzyme
MKYIVIAPEIARESATALADALEAELEFPYETKNYLFSKKKYDFLINYGISKPTKGVKKLNLAEAVKISLDKELTFEKFKNIIPTLVYTKDYQVALSWIKNLKRTVVVRETIKGNNGKGIHFCNTEKQLSKYKDSPLFTRYIPFKSELRVNIFQGKIVSVYSKTIINKFFKFTLQKQLEQDVKLQEIAKKIYETIKIDWCGIDLLCTEKNNYFLIEINSAPVLFPYTLKKLVNLIKTYAAN